jgi:PAS domain S-box-containing protein
MQTGEKPVVLTSAPAESVVTIDRRRAEMLDEYLESYVRRVADYLGYHRSFIALAEAGTYEIRWIAENGQARPVRTKLPPLLERRAQSVAEPFYTTDLSQWAAGMPEPFSALNSTQCLVMPLLGSNRQPLGVVGLLERADGGNVAAEDLRRATSLAAEAAVVLEATANQYAADQHRRRSENLMAAALELNSTVRLPQFMEAFTVRAATMLGARAAALALVQGKHLDTVVLYDPGAHHDSTAHHRLDIALAEVAAQHPDGIISGSARDLLGEPLSASLGWGDLSIARLSGGGGEFIGQLCLADCGGLLTHDSRHLLQALVSHAAVALENARWFTRMDQANRHWMEIFDAITDLIIVHDEGYRVLRVNRSLADMIGLRPPELIGVTVRAVFAMASDESKQPCPFCRGGPDLTDEYVHPVFDRTYLVSTSRIHGAANETMQTIHVLKDITDRREAERRYRELFDTIQEGLFFSTPDGRFVEVNDALVRMLGYETREELLQVDIATQLYVAADQRNRFVEEINSKGVVRNYEETLRRKDGTLIYTLQNAFAVRDSQDKVVQYRGLMLDITEVKNFQAELQRQRDFNNKILNNTQSMILVVDTAGLISYANKRCFDAGGYTQEDLLGRKLVDLVPPGRRQALTDALAETLAGGQVDNLELPVLGQGRGGQYSVNLSPMRDEPGNVNSIVVVMTDITDAAMLQGKLMHAEKMAAVGQLVSGVAHEVNNPLTAVLGFTDLLLESTEVPAHAKEDLRVILQEAQRTKQIVQNLLSFARQMPPQRDSVQLNAIVRRTLALRSYDFASHGVQIVERLNERVPDIVGDAHQLQQVFLNILNNAYDAVRETEHPGRIEIATVYSNGFAEVVFRDNGQGIAFPDRIFDPFFTTKEVGKGTGLGLSICYGIVREHGGEILCQNNSDGEGATFTVRLPIAAVNPAGGLR